MHPFKEYEKEKIIQTIVIKLTKHKTEYIYIANRNKKSNNFKNK